MTDEEMAEEYKESKRHKCLRADVGKIQIDYETYLNNLKEGFLAGLKAGRPQWHDLGKDPKDVPDEGIYLVVWQNARGYRETMIMRYEEDDEEELHWIDGDEDCWDDDIIAWREIPEFEEAD